MRKDPPTLTPLGIFVVVAMGVLGSCVHARAADYRYLPPPPPSTMYEEQTVAQPRPVQTVPVYIAPQPVQQTQNVQVTVVNQPSPQPVYPVRRWNPIGAIMAVPRAALAVPGAILGGDDYEE